jgi:hypothetical protein
MPYYKGVLDELIARGHPNEAQEVAARLLSLRNRLQKQLPPRNVLSSGGNIWTLVGTFLCGLKPRAFL